MPERRELISADSRMLLLIADRDLAAAQRNWQIALEATKAGMGVPQEAQFSGVDLRFFVWTEPDAETPPTPEPPAASVVLNRAERRRLAKAGKESPPTATVHPASLEKLTAVPRDALDELTDNPVISELVREAIAKGPPKPRNGHKTDPAADKAAVLVEAKP